MLWTLKKSIGRKRLRSAIKRVLDDEKSQSFDAEEEHQPHRVLEKAKEALFLQDRAMIIKYRIAALKSRQCKSSENKQFCPEAFLNIIAEKLTYTVSFDQSYSNVFTLPNLCHLFRLSCLFKLSF
jgi:hypothetical protein